MDPLQVEMERLKGDIDSWRDAIDHQEQHSSSTRQGHGAGVKDGHRRKKKWSKLNFKTRSNQNVSFLLPKVCY